LVDAVIREDAFAEDIVVVATVTLHGVLLVVKMPPHAAVSPDAPRVSRGVAPMLSA
jgi:hypothetical protein